MKMKTKIHLNAQALFYAATLLLFADRIQTDQRPPTVIVINTVSAVAPKDDTGKTGAVNRVPAKRPSNKAGCQK